MIKEAYCSFEVAKLLKEKGFDEACYSYYMTTKTLHTTFHNRVHVEEEPHFNSCDLNGMYDVDESSIEDICSAPTHQMAMAWLREKYCLHFIIQPMMSMPSCELKWSADTYDISIFYKGLYEFKCVAGTKLCDSPEEAVEAALKYTLEKLV